MGMRGAGEEGEEAKPLDDEVVVFEMFKERVGEPLRELSVRSASPSCHPQEDVTDSRLLGIQSASIGTLGLLRTSFADAKPMAGAVTLEELRIARVELEERLALFKRAQSDAIVFLYQRLPARKTLSGATNTEGDDADEGPNDNLFRIYYL